MTPASALPRDALPTRRNEAWRYSDLSRALADFALPPDAARGEEHVIARLAGGARAMAVEAGQAVTVVERLEGAGLLAQAQDIRLAPGARLTRVVFQTGGGVALSLARVRLGAGAHFRQIVLAEGASLARVETDVTIEGEHAEVELYGIYLAGTGRHADLTSRVLHEAPNGVTKQRIQGAARAGGRGVFQGKIVVARGAQKTDASQAHHGLLLEEGADISAKPELEIYADDVRCAHGNTAGALDEEALFYLRTRGVEEREARALLTEAFLLEAVPEDAEAEVKDEIAGRIAAWLRGGAS